MNQRLNSRNINEENITGVVIQSLDVRSAWIVIFFCLCQISIVTNYCNILVFQYTGFGFFCYPSFSVRKTSAQMEEQIN
jgi:hypothetical protein